MCRDDIPLRPNKGGAYGTVASATVPVNITIPNVARGAEVYVDVDARIAVTSSTTDLTVDDATFGYLPGGTTRLITFFYGGKATGDLQIQLASRDGSIVTYQISFLG